MKKLGFYLFVFIFMGLSSLAMADDPAGNYAVKGWNPGVAVTGKPSYTGSVSISKVGETYQLDWTIGGQRFGGVGFYYPDKKLLTVGFGDLKAGWFGIVNYENEGSTWKSKWAPYKGKGNAGTEILTKK